MSKKSQGMKDARHRRTYSLSEAGSFSVFHAFHEESTFPSPHGHVSSQTIFLCSRARRMKQGETSA